MYHTPATSKFATHTLHSCISMLPYNDWAAMYDWSPPQASWRHYWSLWNLLLSMWGSNFSQPQTHLLLQKVSRVYGKNFNFFKQHYVSHIITDIRQKGTTDNTSTRPGEGFQQEAAEAFEQTNKKQAEKQVWLMLIILWLTSFFEWWSRWSKLMKIKK